MNCLMMDESSTPVIETHCLVKTYMLCYPPALDLCHVNDLH